MPRASIVPVADAIQVVEEFIKYFTKKPYPVYSSNVWKDMSKFLQGRWTPHNVYVNVRHNRRLIVSTACANKGIPFEDESADHNHNDTTLDSTVTNPANFETTEDEYDFEAESAGLDSFKVRITNEEWKSMLESPVQYGDRKYPILKRGAWTDVLSLAIFHQTQLPCAFVFKNSKIYVTPGSLHYVRIKGYCRSKTCGNQLFCYIDKDPGDADFDITLKTRDTLYENHEDVKRPLRGLKRQEVGKAVFYEGCGNWQKREVLKDTRFGHSVPMHIPNLQVLRQAKMEYVNNQLQVQPSDGKDIVNTIEKMKNIAPYHGFIHEVKREKFYVSFGTPAQLYAYKQYCKTVQPNSTISVDGTGSIVKPLIRYDGSQSGHIFLYSVVVNFDHTTLSVYDLLTESQETDVFWWWLNHWLKLGAPKPAFAVCDSSRALLNGMSLSFNHQTIKTYIETCFLYAIKSTEYYYRPPVNTYIRLDVAHLMAMVRRWKCVKNMRHVVVRQFFLYCVALMCDCQTLEQFRDIFSLTCTVALHAFLDSKIQVIRDGTVNDARKKLETYIATRNLTSANEDDEADGDEMCYEDENEDNEATNRSRIKEWIIELRSTSEIAESQGTQPNPFYFDEFIQRFLPLAYEFPLWTGIAIPHEVQRGTSTFSEGHFNDLKNRVLRNYPRPLRVDKFLKLEFEDNKGSATILSSKLKNYNQVTNAHPSSSPPLRERQDADRRKKLPNNKNTRGITPTNVGEINNNNEPKFNDKTDIKQCTVQQNTIQNDFKLQPLIEHEEELPPTPDATEMFLTSTNADDINNNNDPKINDTKHIIDPILQKNTNTQKGIGKYFRPQPDIEHCNNRATNIKKSWLLQNGNKVHHSAQINGKSYFAYNTCGWDSIVQILSNSAMDDPEYLRSIDTSTNGTLQFVVKFTKTGPSAALYKERVRVLKPLFEDNVKANYNKSKVLSSYSIDIWGSVAAIWTRCFRSHPCAFDSYECRNCGNRTLPVVALCVNHKIIGKNGFQALHQALDLSDHPRTIRCSNENCSEMCMEYRNYGSQIFIELDIRPELSASKGMACKLRDFPEILDLGDQHYRLAGVVAATPGHFFAYCRRGNNLWELCNDTNTKVMRASSTTTIVPHGAIYICMKQKFSPVVLPESRQSAEEEYFPVKVPLNDSDVTSQDNWRNKGDTENFCYKSNDDNNNSENSSKVIQADDAVSKMLIDGEDYEILACYNITL